MTPRITSHFRTPAEPQIGGLAEWLNPTSGPQARRLKPSTEIAIVKAHKAGDSGAKIARDFGVSRTTVARVIARTGSDFTTIQKDLAPLADAERELRELAAEGLFDPQAVEDLIEMARLGMLIQQDDARKAVAS